ncbi:MAG: HD domain-containing protein [Xanthomonadales bacterium]|nr:HD domain-containing protein [Xanthomonadales bacterium]
MNFHLANLEPLPSAVLMRRDASTAQHCDRVGAMALALATLLGFSDAQLRVIGVAAHMHDVGKIGIPDAILRKPGALNAQEWAVMREHSARGEAIIRADQTLTQRDEAAAIVRHHHEHFDGSGYPDGIGGEEIPLAARLLSVVDSYDAMTESRAYHRVRSHQEALAVLESERGSKHDPLMVELIRSCDASWLIGLQLAK